MTHTAEMTDTAQTGERLSGEPSILELLADLLEYPCERTTGKLEVCLAQLRESSFPEASGFLADLRAYLAENSLSSAQELYSHTFDLNPVCPLEVGYYLFGEDYRRGVFLALLRESQEEVGLDGGHELPDHLPLLLRWLSRVCGTELYTDMVFDCLMPVLKKMTGSMAEGGNPYLGVIKTVLLVLERGFPEEKSGDA